MAGDQEYFYPLGKSVKIYRRRTRRKLWNRLTYKIILVVLLIILPLNLLAIFTLKILSETLWKHLAEIDEESNEMMDRLVKRMAESEGVTKQLKSDYCGASCYGAFKGEQSSAIALKMSMADFACEKLLTEVAISAKIFRKKRCYRKATVRLG